MKGTKNAKNMLKNIKNADFACIYHFLLLPLHRISKRIETFNKMIRGV